MNNFTDSLSKIVEVVVVAALIYMPWNWVVAIYPLTFVQIMGIVAILYISKIIFKS